jgi:hypothetical protein
MTGKTSGDSSKRVSHDIFWRIHESFTTQSLQAGSAPIHCESALPSPMREVLLSKLSTLHGVVFAIFVAALGGYPAGDCNPSAPGALGWRSSGATPMPYALFSNDAKLSKTYPREADVWKHARKSGLVVDVVSEEEKAAPRPVLDNDYEIRPCRPEPDEDPAKNQAEAEREEALELELGL